MKKKMQRLLVVILMMILAVCSFGRCRKEEKEIEGLENLQKRVYVLTDVSYEEYLSEYVGPTNSRPWCAILDRQITLSTDVQDIYEIIEVENKVYRAENVKGSVSLWLEDTILHLRRKDKEFLFQEDTSYTFVPEKQEKLEQPREIQTSEGANRISFRWNYQAGYGTLGARVVLKTSQSEKAVAIDVEYVYRNEFVVEIGKEKLTEGENLVYLYQIGGPMLNNQKELFLTECSEAVVFSVTVTENDYLIKEQGK